jgi:myo-inositol-1(or 4)-monophosphatase
VWYLDPIDGTTNFVSQHRNYAVSVGCYQDGVPAFGLVLDVERGALYSARHGGGALRDETPIHVSHCGVLRDALLTTPGVLHTFLREHPRRAGLVELAGAVRGVRSMGCVALELCAVAAGEAELFVALRSCPWDHNAARIILAEAGGCICALDGAPLPQDAGSAVLAACSRPLLEQVLAGISANTSSREKG